MRLGNGPCGPPIKELGIRCGLRQGQSISSGNASRAAGPPPVVSAVLLLHPADVLSKMPDHSEVELALLGVLRQRRDLVGAE